jgi:DNA-directed RNA polymerase subunit beta'
VLRGLKENVIIGHLIPAGTGMKRYRNIRVKEENLIDLESQVESLMESRKAALYDDDYDEADMEQEMLSEGEPLDDDEDDE